MSSLQQTRYEFPARTTIAPQRQGKARSTCKVATNFSAHLVNANSETISGTPLTVALIGPNQGRRSAAMIVLNNCGGNEVCEFASYPPALEDVPKMLEENYDAVIVELDSDPEYALDLVESIGANGRATVMVYSDSSDSELLVRCMQAGAREFLSYPFSSEVMAEALVRATARRPVVVDTAKAAGKLLAVMGAKGGAGTTMLACNLAVALAQEKNQKTLLIDLDLPLGDAALNLGIVTEFSTIDALEAADRLDARFLSQLLVKHSSGRFAAGGAGEVCSQFKASEHSHRAADPGGAAGVRQRGAGFGIEAGPDGNGGVPGSDHDVPGDASQHSGTAQLEPSDFPVFPGPLAEAGNRDQPV